MLQPAGKNIALLCNPLAGAGKAADLQEKIATALTIKKISFTPFRQIWPEKFQSFTDIWIIGGDGTLHYFINQYPGIQVPLVIFKGGTGNDFHWLLYGSMTVEQQLERVLESTPKRVDLGRCNDRYFINGAGIGFEGEVVRALAGKKKRSGKTSFLLMILRKIFSYRSANYHIQSAERTIRGCKFLVDVSNGSRAGGGFHIAPDARADDGLFDVVIIQAVSPFQRLRYLPVIEKGKHLSLSITDHFRTREISIQSSALIRYHLDGEYYTAAQLEISMKAGLLLFRH